MSIITPNWKVAKNIHAFTTTRHNPLGVSPPPFDRFNLASHVGDQTTAVSTNRQHLVEHYQLPHLPLFLNQIHSTNVIELPNSQHHIDADASYTNHPNQVCLVMTADCLPILFTNQAGTEIAAAHAGWRGLCNGILEQTVKKFIAPTSQIIAWLGPAISAKAFEVGEEVMHQFIQQDQQAIAAFQPQPTPPHHPTKFCADLYLLAKQRLNHLGIEQIYGGEYCTYHQPELFYSYRREKQTGRMASLIWFTS
ncbi:multi-copper polyphenol oxidoreductase [Mergibacter septicus]|uniref:peptidoglycan editing factor PgeF n=1 Tax=Mergibacter septicus TaxID=221402 RepID=UPI001C7533A3|nr:peptidoglycan editing factor PgeF [Mergibacter septicus]QDJ12420.1 multi-copper polyphenol oxidoreductase [Mergibacter septicus]